MGLDMYLTGKKFIPNHEGNQREVVDGYEVSSMDLDLGQWRKHWALHNYINDNYGDGYKIELNSDNLREIFEEVEHGHLLDANYRDEIDEYHKEPEQVAKTAKILADAADWLDKEDNTWKSVEYYGSW